MQKKEEKINKSTEITKINRLKIINVKEEKKIEKNIMVQSTKQIRKIQNIATTPIKNLSLPTFDIICHSKIKKIIKDQKLKNESTHSPMISSVKENYSRKLSKVSKVLNPAEETVNRKLSLMTSKSFVQNKENKYARLLKSKKRTMNDNNIKLVKYTINKKSSLPSQEKSCISENQTKKSISSVSPLRVLKFDNATEDENDRLLKLKQISKKKKLFIFDKSKSYVYIVLRGNNSALIKKCMQHRSNWKESVNYGTSLFNFKWQQNCRGIDFSSLSRFPYFRQMVNHFEHHQQISNKLSLFINLIKYCEEKGLDVFKYVPFTIIMQYDSSFYEHQMTSFTDFFINIKDYITSNHNVDHKYKKYSSLFKVDPFDRIGSKTNLYIHPNMFNEKNFWLVKATDMNRGRCIKIGDSVLKIQKLIKKFYDGISRELKEGDENESILDEEKKNNSIIKLILKKDFKNEKNTKEDEEEKKDKKNNNSFKKYRTSIILLQKYLEKPLLYWNRKFDIRLWVLVTHKYHVFAFREGHLKTSSEEFNINLKDSYVHLTNYSVQKYSNNFSKFEHGNEVSFTDFQTYLNHDYPDKISYVKTQLFEKMKELISVSMKSAADKINSYSRKHCFEIYGYDFIMDSDFNVYLLEINTNPGLEESSPLINKILPRMIDDAFRLTIDDIFETKYNWEESNNPKEISNLKDTTAREQKTSEKTYCSPFSVEGYSDSENLFSFVCSLLHENSNKKIN